MLVAFKFGGRCPVCDTRLVNNCSHALILECPKCRAMKDYNLVPGRKNGKGKRKKDGDK